MVIRPAMTAVALALALGECRACKSEPPPILFPGAEGGGVEGDDASLALRTDGAAADGGVVPRTLAQLVQGSGRSIVVEGVTVTAPEGAAFHSFLARDVDGDGDNDLVATITRRDGNATVLFYTRDEAAYVLGASTNLEAPSRACVPSGLASFTAQTWTVRYEQCAAPASPALGDAGVAQDELAPNTVMTEHVALSVDGGGAVGRLRLSELGPSIAHTQLSFDLAFVDRDGDGRSDVIAEVSAARDVDGPDAPRARATVLLLDRGVGFARDTSEPTASVARLLSQTRTLAANRRRALDAVAMIERVQRLRRALCVEAGAPRVRLGGEAGLRCGAMFNGFGEAYARAMLTLGEFAAAEATQWPDTATEFGVVDSERFDQELQRTAGSETGVSARSGPFVGAAIDDWLLRRPVLALEPPSAPTHVLLRGPTRARIELGTFANVPEDEGSSRELRLESPDGSRVAVGAWQTCDGVVVALCPSSDERCAAAPVAASLPAGATLVRLTDLPSPEFSARCMRREASSEPIRRAAELRPIGWGAEGLVLAWRGRLLRASGEREAFAALNNGALGAGFAAGAASPDGRHVALQGADAVYVRDAAGRWRAWRPPQLSGRLRQLTDLTVSGDGRTIVGRLGTQLWVIERQAVSAGG